MTTDKKCRARLHEDGEGWPEVGDYVIESVSGQAYEVVEIGEHISTHGPGVGNSRVATVRPVVLDPEDYDSVIAARVVLGGD